MGTPEAMYREDGDKVWACELNSYGKVRKFQGEYKTECPFRYQGQYEDSETGLYYNRFRYYSPDEGVYISQDPIRLGGGISLYSYVHDTSGWVDEFGLYLRRPYIRNTTRIGAEKNASIVDGRFVDANDGSLEIPGGKRRSFSLAEGEYDLGHKPGHEFWREKAKAEAEGLTQKEFNERMNDSSLYQIEHPSENQSHEHEDKSPLTC